MLLLKSIFSICWWKLTVEINWLIRTPWCFVTDLITIVVVLCLTEQLKLTLYAEITVLIIPESMIPAAVKIQTSSYLSMCSDSSGPDWHLPIHWILTEILTHYMVLWNLFQFCYPCQINFNSNNKWNKVWTENTALIKEFNQLPKAKLLRFHLFQRTWPEQDPSGSGVV